MVVAELFTILGFQVSKVQFNAANDAINSLEKNFKKSFTEINSALEVGKKALHAFTGVIESTLGKAFNITNDIALKGDDIAALADKFGLTTDAIQELGAAAEMGDTSTEGLLKGMQKLAKIASEAASGGKEAQEAFQGIKYKDSNGKLKSTQELLFAVSERISKTTNATERLALAQKLLGKEGGNLIPMLSGGPEAIKANIELYLKTNAKILSGQIKAGQAYDDAKRKLTQYIAGFKNLFIGERAIQNITRIYETLVSIMDTPVARDIIRELGRLWEEASESINKYLIKVKEWLSNPENAKEALNTIREIKDAIVKTADAMIPLLKHWKEFLILMGMAKAGVVILQAVMFMKNLTAVTGTVGAAATVSSGGFWALAASIWAAVAPIIPFIAAGAALVAVGYSIYKNWDKIVPVLESIGKAAKFIVFDAAVDSVKQLWNWVNRLFTEIGKFTGIHWGTEEEAKLADKDEQKQLVDLEAERMQHKEESGLWSSSVTPAAGPTAEELDLSKHIGSLSFNGLQKQMQRATPVTRVIVPVSKSAAIVNNSNVTAHVEVSNTNASPEDIKASVFAGIDDALKKYHKETVNAIQGQR